MVIDFIPYLGTKIAQAAALEALEAAEKAEARSRVNLEWVLADLLADIQAA